MSATYPVRVIKDPRPSVTPAEERQRMMPICVDPNTERPFIVQPGECDGARFVSKVPPLKMYCNPSMRELMHNRMWYASQPWHRRTWLRILLLFRAIKPFDLGEISCNATELDAFLKLTDANYAYTNDMAERATCKATQIERKDPKELAEEIVADVLKAVHTEKP